MSRKNTGKAFISESIGGGARDKRRAVDGRSASGDSFRLAMCVNTRGPRMI
jgi:hypothetical protein